MMVLNRAQKLIQDSLFHKFPSFFNKGDLLILNNTKVLPARLWGTKKTGGKVEVLLVGATARSPDRGEESGPAIWECLIRSMKGLKPDSQIFFSFRGKEIFAILKTQGERKFLQFPPETSVEALMKEEGAAPLPPYIKRKEGRPEDLERYQTVFAEKEGAIAAPTASLHFTPRILSALQERGVEIQYVTLHVGIGTFQPVTAERVEDHRMQTEYYEISKEVAESIQRAKKEGRLVTAIGTTTVRAVESYFHTGSASPAPPPLKGGGKKNEITCSQLSSPLRGEGQGGGDSAMNSTNLFIHPGYQFKIIDRLLTNFHQPESTPLFLTSAFAGKKFLFSAYREAIEKRYRLFSYGDCMWII